MRTVFWENDKVKLIDQRLLPGEFFVAEFDTVAGVVAILVVLGLIVSVWAAISPRSLWWTTSAWRFKDPASNEPSDAARVAERLQATPAQVADVEISAIE